MCWPFHASKAEALQWQNTSSEAPAASRAAGSWLDWSEDVAYTILVAMVFLWSALSIDWRTAEPATAALSSHIAWGVRLLVLPWGVLWVVLPGSLLYGASGRATCRRPPPAPRAPGGALTMGIVQECVRGGERTSA